MKVPKPLAVLVAMVACSDDNSPPPDRQGELGNGSFAYRCVADDDAYCDGSSFPPAIALGARFDLSYTPEDAAAGPVNVDAISDRRVSEEHDEFRILDSGWNGFVARGTYGEIVDLVHLEGLPVVSISATFAANEPAERIDGTVGEAVLLLANVHDEIDRRLGGAVAYAFVVADPELARVSSLSGRTIQVDLLAEGSTILTISAADQMLSIPIRIGPAPETGSESGTDGSTTAESTGTESDGGAETETNGGTETDTDGGAATDTDTDTDTDTQGSTGP